MRHAQIAVSAIVFLASLAIPLSARATPQLFMQAKGSGLPVQNCQYCHAAAMPKKETFKPEDLNARGKWLLSEKDQEHGKDIKAEWLKNYTGGK